MNLRTSILNRLLKDEASRRLLDNFASLTLLQGLQYILPLLTVPYLVRVIGPEKYGLIAFASAFVFYFKMLTDYGFNQSATREIAINRDNQAKVAELFSCVWILQNLLTLVSFVLLCFIVFYTSFSQDWVIYFFAFGQVVGNSLTPWWFFLGMERMRYVTILNVVSSIIFTLSIFLFIRQASDYLYVPLITSVGSITAGVISLWIVFRDFKLKPILPGIRPIFNAFRDSTQFFLSRASVSVYTTSNTFFLGLFTNPLTVGYYTAAQAVYTAAQGLYQPLVTVLYPHMSKTANKPFFKNVFKTSVLLNAFFCALLFIFSRQIIVIIFGSNFLESIVVLRIFALALFVVVPSILLGYPFLAALGQAKYANGSVIVGSLFHLTALLVISQTFISAPAVALLVVATESIVLVMRVWGVKRHKLWN